MIITIDGETFLGKSSVAKLVAKRLDFLHISLGVFFKALIYIFLENNIDLSNVKLLEKEVPNACKRISFYNTSIFYDSEDITEKIECTDIYEKCSIISANEKIKAAVIKSAKRLVRSDNVVMDGREIGTIVFPEADFKFFFTSSEDRFNTNNESKKALLDALKYKNEQDIKNGIVKCPDKAVRICVNNFKNKEELAEFIVDLIIKKSISVIRPRSTVALIPARSGSQGIKNKNITLINGKPLLAYSVETALTLKGINKAYITTDSTRYIKIAKQYGPICPILRPKRIALSNSVDLEYVKHFLFKIYSLEGWLPAKIVLLRPTTPLRDGKIIDQALNKIKKHPEATSLRSVQKASFSPYKMFKIGADGFYKPLFESMTLDDCNLPRQLFETCYVPNGYVDVLLVEHILKTDTLFGDRIIAFEVEQTVDIDCKRDLNNLKRK